MSARLEAQRLVDAPASGSSAAQSEAIVALRTALPPVTDRVARMLIRRVRGGGAAADAICVALVRKDFPR